MKYVLIRTGQNIRILGPFDTMKAAALYMVEEGLFGYTIQPVAQVFADPAQAQAAQLDELLAVADRGGVTEGGRRIFTVKVTHLSPGPLVDRDMARFLTVISEEFPKIFSVEPFPTARMVDIIRKMFGTKNVKVPLPDARKALAEFTKKEG